MSTGLIERPTENQPRKPSAAKTWLKAIELTSRIEAEPSRLFADVVEDWAVRQPDRPALVSDAQTLSYRELAERINRYARWALSAGIKRGDTVCLIMPARPDYVAAWLGISRVGGAVALINTKLVGQSLAHCVNVARSGHIILASELADVFATARPLLERAPKVWSDENVDAALARLDGDPLSAAERREVTINDRALLIYTSGTTGLPKAAYVSHRRVMNWTHWFAGMTGASADDRLYNCLPMYHSVGGVVAPVRHAVCRRRPSCSREILRHALLAGCGATSAATIFQYIGELCRYLLKARHPSSSAAPAAPGVRQWPARRHLGSIPGALRHSADPGILCGDRGQFLALQCRRQDRRHRPYPAASWRIAFPPPSSSSILTVGAAPARRLTVLCIACARRGEAGEAHRQDRDDGGGRFEGYTDAAARLKRRSCAMSSPGDAWFRTGDSDAPGRAGLLLFRRPRSATPSAGRARMSPPPRSPPRSATAPGVSDATIYGVEVPATNGRCRHGGARSGRRFRPDGLPAPIWRRGCRPMPGRCSCVSAQASMRPRPSSRRSISSRARVSIPLPSPSRSISAIPCRVRIDRFRPKITRAS